MKKLMLTLMAALMLMSSNVLAADGDLIVEGNLGVGIDDPVAPLTVNGNAYITRHGNPAEAGAFIVMNRTRGTIDNPTDVTSGNSIGGWRLDGRFNDVAQSLGELSVWSNINAEGEIGSSFAFATKAHSDAVPRVSMGLSADGNLGLYERNPVGRIHANDLLKDYVDATTTATVEAAIASGSSYTDPCPLPYHYSGVWNGYRAYGDCTAPAFVIRGMNIGIGTDDPIYAMDVVGDIYASGTINCSGSATCMNEGSDKRLKDNIDLISSPIDKLKMIRGVSYTWKETSEDKKSTVSKQYGVLAQEVEKVLPELVSEMKNGYKSVSYTRLVPVLIEAVKEQQNMIDSQKKEIAALKAESLLMKSLEARLQTLESRNMVASALK